MSTIGTWRAESSPTVDRVSAAWAAARPTARQAVLVAALSAVVASAVVPAPPTVRWAVAAVGLLLAVAALVDVHECKLPNRLLAAAFVVAIGGAAVTTSWSIIVASVLGALVAGGSMLVVRLGRGVGTGGVGMGDVKMAGVIGASAGSVALVAAPIAISLAAFAAAGYGLLAGRRRLPLGPALWLGWASALALCAVGWLP